VLSEEEHDVAIIIEKARKKAVKSKRRAFADKMAKQGKSEQVKNNVKFRK